MQGRLRKITCISYKLFGKTMEIPKRFKKHTAHCETNTQDLIQSYVV